jgi:hydroxymethylpyrimidine pyrophosphatase-like HAD family hydrolase
MSSDLFSESISEKIKASKELVIIADKDGVLCPPHGKIEPLKEIMNIIKAGATFVVISGANIDRAMTESVEPLLNAVGKETGYLKKIFLILNNGSSIYHFKGNRTECLYKREIKKEIGEEKSAKTLEILGEAVIKFMEISEMKKRFPEIRQINDEGTQIVLRILGKIKNDELRRTFDPDGKRRIEWAGYIRKRLKEEGINLNVSVDGTSSINLLLPGADKGTGIDHLIDILNMPRSSLIYLGDNFSERRNDRIAVEGRIDLAVNFGKDIHEKIRGVTLINAAEKGPAGARDCLNSIYKILCSGDNSTI